MSFHPRFPSESRRSTVVVLEHLANPALALNAARLGLGALQEHFFPSSERPVVQPLVAPPGECRKTLSYAFPVSLSCHRAAKSGQ